MHNNQNIQYAKKKRIFTKINLISAPPFHPCLHYYWMTSEDWKQKLLSIKVPQSFSIPLLCNGVSWTIKTYFRIQSACEIYAISSDVLSYIVIYIYREREWYTQVQCGKNWQPIYIDQFSLIYKLYVVAFDIIIIPQNSKMVHHLSHIMM